MLRAKMEIDPGTGKGPEGLEPTAEDYRAALAAVEELKELAEKEPAIVKVLGILGRLSANAVAMVAYACKEVNDFTDGMPTDQHPMADSISAFSKANFEDAAHKLEQLKQKSEQYDKN